RDGPGRCEFGRTLHLGGEELRIVASKTARGRPVIRLERRVERGAVLEVPREALPPPAADSYYVFQLVGLEVVEEGGKPLGWVEAVAPGVANGVLELGHGHALP